MNKRGTDFLRSFVKAIIKMSNKGAFKTTNLPDNTKHVYYNKPKVPSKSHSNLNWDMFVNQSA